MDTNLHCSYTFELIATKLAREKWKENTVKLGVVYFNLVNFVVPRRILGSKLALWTSSFEHVLIVYNWNVGLKGAILNYSGESVAG